MKKRILTALVLIPVLVLILVSDSWVITGAVAIVSVIGLFEFYKATGVIQKKALAALGFFGGLGVALRTYIPSEYYQVLCLAALLILFVIMLKCHKTVGVDDAGLMLFGILYVPYLLSFISNIAKVEGGYFCLWTIVIGAFATDTFAYFTGVFFGKHKLCPEISPKKTIEGSIGGTIGCVLTLLIYEAIIDWQFGQSMDVTKLMGLGVLVAVVSQIGDLTASIIKRKYGVKDYGTIFPGHGGILDRLDSVITTAPLVYIYVNTIGLV